MIWYMTASHINSKNYMMHLQYAAKLKCLDGRAHDQGFALQLRNSECSQHLNNTVKGHVWL